MLLAPYQYTITIHNTPVTPFASHTLCVFIDESEYKNNYIGSVSIDFISAIETKSTPILVSSALYNNIFFSPQSIDTITKRYTQQDNLSDIEAKKKEALHIFMAKKKILNAYNGNKKEILEQLHALSLSLPKLISIEKEEIMHAIIRSEINFDPHEWHIYNTDFGMHLMIPNDWYQKQYLLANKKKISIDYLIGLRISSLINISSSEFIACQKASQNINALVGKKYTPPTNFTHKQLFKLFLTNADYKNITSHHDTVATPRWALFLNGHGFPNQSIAGVSIEEMKHLLNFFNTNITTKLLVYQSCYSAGINATLLYKDLYNHTQENLYKFAILTTTPTTMETKNKRFNINVHYPTETDINWHQKKFMLITKDKVPYDTIVSIITQPYQKELFPYLNIIAESQVAPKTALIRLPDTAWFSPLTTNKKNVVIGNILTKNRAHNKPLDINHYFKTKEPTTLLIHPHIIHFPLLINTPTILTPMHSGDYYINELHIKNSTIEEVTNLLPQHIYLALDTTLFIKKIIINSTHDILHNVYLCSRTQEKKAIIFWSYHQCYYTKSQEEPIARLQNNEEKKQYTAAIEKHSKCNFTP